MPGYPIDRAFRHQPVSCLDHLPGFLVIGILATLLDMSLLYLLTEIAGLWYLIAAGISYTSGGIYSYILNKELTFHNPSRRYVRQGLLFLAISAAGLVLNTGVIWLGVEVSGLHYLMAKAGATAIAFFWNFFAQSTITFRVWR